MGLLMTVQKIREGRLQKSYAFEADHKRLIKIGSMSGADISIDSGMAARLQAVIEMKGKEAAIRELGTLQGTRLNGETIDLHREEIYTEDTINIGDTDLKVTLSQKDKHTVDNSYLLFEGLSAKSITELYRFTDYLRHREGLCGLSSVLTGAQLSQPQDQPQYQSQAQAQPQPESQEPLGDEEMELEIVEDPIVSFPTPVPPPLPEDLTGAEVSEFYDTRRLVAQMQDRKRRGSYGLLTFVVLLAIAAGLWMAQVGAGGLALPSLLSLDSSLPMGAEVAAPLVAKSPAASTSAARSSVVQAKQVSKAAAPIKPKYSVRPGDTLGRIAASRLGSPKRWEEIYKLNTKILKSPSALEVGMKLEMPAVR